MIDRRIFLFPSRRAAEAAYLELLASGFQAHDLNLFVHAPPPHAPREKTETDRVSDATGAVGAELGGAAGGIGGALAGLGFLPLPGLGPLLAVGPLAAALTGAITGGALGGFAGSLAGLGVAEAEAFASEEHLKAGLSVLVVDCGMRCEEAERLANSAGALDPDAL